MPWRCDPAPFFMLSSVSSAPNTLVRDAGRADSGTSSTSAPLAARRAGGREVPSRGPSAAVDERTVPVGDRSGGDLGTLHRRRERTRQRDHDNPGRPIGSRPTVCRLERSRWRRRRLGQGWRRRALRPELGGGELDAIDELGVADADRKRNDLDAQVRATSRGFTRAASRSDGHGAVATAVSPRREALPSRAGLRRRSSASHLRPVTKASVIHLLRSTRRARLASFDAGCRAASGRVACGGNG